MKLLEDDKGENLNNLGFDDEFLDTTLKAGSMGGKVNKQDFIKLKTSALQERHC